MALKHRTHVSISLPHELAAWLKAQATKEKRLPSYLIEMILEQYRTHIESTEKNIFEKR